MKWPQMAVGLALVASISAVACVSWLATDQTPAARGALIAKELGCLNCHGPAGAGGVPNPGSRDGEIPAFDGGVAMMYIENEAEIREWILYGEPQRLSQAAHKAESTGLIDMPAYEGKLSERELEDLVAYFKAVSAFVSWPEDPRVREGWRVASRSGCFGCHGASGRVPMPNPRSLKGSIPAWDGADFAELVHDEAELRGWIMDGEIPRLKTHVVANKLLERQVIKMPAYRSLLSQEELDALVAYVRWLRPEGTL